MTNETVAFGGPLAGVVLGMIVMLVGVTMGGVNSVLGGGSALMVLSVGWLALTLALLEPPADYHEF